MPTGLSRDPDGEILDIGIVTIECKDECVEFVKDFMRDKLNQMTTATPSYTNCHFVNQGKK